MEDTWIPYRRTLERVRMLDLVSIPTSGLRSRMQWEAFKKVCAFVITEIDGSQQI